jgi:molybdopterin molybdotransferase
MMEKMVSYEQARKLILSKTETLPSELVDIHKALGRVLAEDALALVGLPLTAVSFRDGYAINSEESGPGKRFTFAGKILAGNPLTEPLAPGTTWWVATEAVMPEGADAVVEEEKIRKYGDTIELQDFIEPGLNVRPAGEEFNEGELLLAKGTVLCERHIALLLAGGHFELNVIRRPRLWVIAVGDELRHPGSVIRAGQEYPSAGWIVAMLAEETGCELARVIITEDASEALLEAVPDVESADLVITVGGTGFGRKDIIEETLKHLGAEVIFEGVKMRPSHSFIFSMKGKQVIYSLPGRISATEVGFEFLARPGIWKMQGKSAEQQFMLPVRVLREIPAAEDQCHILRGKLTKKDGENWVEPLHRKSWHKELIEADGLILIDEKRGTVKSGDWVNFMIYPNRLAALVIQKFL